MRHFFSPLSRSRLMLATAGGVALVTGGIAVWAQVEGDRGIAPVAASGDISVGGIEVDTKGKTAQDARDEGWLEAQKLAWKKINGPAISDLQLQSLVSAVVIERERLGAGRYIATLGVIFDRQRASRFLGAQGQAARSAPMLLIPVTMSGGTNLVYEQRNPWQRAWAEYQSGASRIDYVRPSGAGGELLLVTYGQTGRRSRIWWRTVLDQFGGSDVLVPIARLEYSYPGGPVTGRFTARYGPDSEHLASFSLTAANPSALPKMLDQAVLRFNTIFERALADGKLTPDPTLNVSAPTLSPAVARLIEMGRAARAREAAAAAAREAAAAGRDDDDAVNSAPVRNPPPEGSVALYTVQFATPDAASFDATVTAVRSAPGVKGAGTRSTAIGGTSVMTVSYSGSIEDLAAALRGRGLTVRQSGNSLSISR